MKRAPQLLLLSLVLVALLCATAAAEEWIPVEAETTVEVVAEWNEPDSPLLAMAHSDNLIYFEDIDAPLQAFLQTRARCIFDTLRPSQLMQRLSWVTELDLSEYPGTLTDARWLWMFENLTSITLTDATFADLNIIGEFTQLQELTLLNCGYFSLVPLENCTALTSLTLGWDADYQGETGTFDLTPLTSLKKLVTLALYGSGMTDLSPLSSIAKRISTLTLSNTAAEDYAPLKKLTGLKSLTLDLLQSDTAAEILGLCSKSAKVLTLQELIFDSDVEAAAQKYKSLTDYALIDCDVSNELFYEDLNKSTRLTLQSIAVSDGTEIGYVYADKTAMVLEGTPEPVMLSLLNSRSTGLSALTMDLESLSEDMNAMLRKKTSLNTLTLCLNADTDLAGTAWKKITGIRTLTIESEGSTLLSTDFLNDLINVRTLTLSGVQVDDPAGIGTAKNINTLCVYGCKISDWSFLADMFKLETVKVYASGITNDVLPYFADVSTLTELRLDGNEITDISALAGNDTITKLDILDNPIEDYSTLLSMTGLSTVYSNGNGGITSHTIMIRSVYIDDVDYDAIYAAAFGAEDGTAAE